jgi:hypothetical protein
MLIFHWKKNSPIHNNRSGTPWHLYCVPFWSPVPWNLSLQMRFSISIQLIPFVFLHTSIVLYQWSHQWAHGEGFDSFVNFHLLLERVLSTNFCRRSHNSADGWFSSPCHMQPSSEAVPASHLYTKLKRVGKGAYGSVYKGWAKTYASCRLVVLS